MKISVCDSEDFFLTRLYYVMGTRSNVSFFQNQFQLNIHGTGRVCSFPTEMVSAQIFF